MLYGLGVGVGVGDGGCRGQLVAGVYTTVVHCVSLPPRRVHVHALPPPPWGLLWTDSRVQANSSSITDFEWLSQLRLYYRKDEGEFGIVDVQQTNCTLTYGYEYAAALSVCC